MELKALPWVAPRNLSRIPIGVPTNSWAGPKDYYPNGLLQQTGYLPSFPSPFGFIPKALGFCLACVVHVFSGFLLKRLSSYSSLWTEPDLLITPHPSSTNFTGK